MMYLELFWVFFQVGLFSIGGGYAAIPIIQDLAVTQKAWMTTIEFTELITIAEMTPGPITLNAATYIGNSQAGVGGAILASFSCVLPSIIIVSIVAFVYFKFSKLTAIQGTLKQLRPVIIGLIASSCLGMVINAFWGGIGNINISSTQWIAIATFGVCIFLLRYKDLRMNPIFILAFSGAIALAVEYVPYLFH